MFETNSIDVQTEQSVMSERELVEQYLILKKQKDSMNKELKDINKALELTIITVCKRLEDEDKQSTAKYEGLGCLQAMPPKIRASIRKPDQESVFETICNLGRGDIIKQSIHPSTLSTFVKEFIENGEPVPDGIVTYFQPNVKFIKSAM